MKKNKLLKKACIYMLVGVIASSSVFLSYDNAKTVKAVAVVDDIAILMAVLATFGVSINVAKMVQTKVLEPFDEKNWDWGGDWDRPADVTQEDWEHMGVLLGKWTQAELDAAKKKYGGDSGGDNDPWNWDNLKEIIKKDGLKGAKTLAVCSALASIIVSDAKKSQSIADGQLVDVECSSLTEATGYTFKAGFLHDVSLDAYYKSYLKLNWVVGYIFDDRGSVLPLVNSSGNLSYPYRFNLRTPTPTKPAPYSLSERNNMPRYVKEDGTTEQGFQIVGFDGSYLGITSCVILLPSLISSLTWKTSVMDDYVGLEDVGNLNFPPDVLDTYGGNEPVLDTPSTDSPTIPSNQDIMDYLQDLKDAEDNNEDTQPLIDSFIDSLTKSDVDPTPDPDPAPNPDPTPDPTKPDTSPENPNDLDTENQVKKTMADLKLVFPFCIPFDLIGALSLLSSSPEAPRIVIPIKISALNIDEQIVFDFSEFPYVGEISRVMFTLLFILGLILATRALIKG